MISVPTERLLNIVESNDPIAGLTALSIDMANAAVRSAIGLPYLFLRSEETAFSESLR